MLSISSPAICRHTCWNGGICIDVDTCSCPSGYEGSQCKTRKLKIIIQTIYIINTQYQLLHSLLYVQLCAFLLMDARMEGYVFVPVSVLVQQSGKESGAMTVSYPSNNYYSSWLSIFFCIQEKCISMYSKIITILLPFQQYAYPPVVTMESAHPPTNVSVMLVGRGQLVLKVRILLYFKNNFMHGNTCA